MPLECKYIAPFCVCYDCRNVKGLTQVAGVCIRNDISAGSAAAGVTNLNRTGIRHSALSDFSIPLHRFCDRMAVSIAFTFLSCLFLAISAILDVLWLSYY
ncbi:Casparian strip membrane protein domain-containing protein [Dioscorea alata]|uniref:Casparian strip membrane protein domain-containing protein n=1 Tax=Dioscorea alata TaxID=55571 RepID=A0ACB7TS89_DIOAL|nr:Casparian strip membrane protein domain-containing protein [Dioscorea alata]